MDSTGLNAITYNHTWWVFSSTNGPAQFMWWIFSGLVSETEPRVCRVRGLSAIMGLDGYMWTHFKQDHQSATKERVLSHWAASAFCTDHSGLVHSVTISPIYCTKHLGISGRCNHTIRQIRATADQPRRGGRTNDTSGPQTLGRGPRLVPGSSAPRPRRKNNPSYCSVLFLFWNWPMIKSC